jgi:hypothetical protein
MGRTPYHNVFFEDRTGFALNEFGNVVHLLDRTTGLGQGLDPVTGQPIRHEDGGFVFYFRNQDGGLVRGYDYNLLDDSDYEELNNVVRERVRALGWWPQGIVREGEAAVSTREIFYSSLEYNEPNYDQNVFNSEDEDENEDDETPVYGTSGSTHSEVGEDEGSDRIESSHEEGSDVDELSAQEEQSLHDKEDVEAEVDVDSQEEDEGYEGDNEDQDQDRGEDHVDDYGEHHHAENSNSDTDNEIEDREEETSELGSGEDISDNDNIRYACRSTIYAVNPMVHHYELVVGRGGSMFVRRIHDRSHFFQLRRGADYCFNYTIGETLQDAERRTIDTLYDGRDGEQHHIWIT